MEDVVFSNHTVDFVKIALEFCSLVENTKESDRESFIDRAGKILPMLYLNALLIPEVEEYYDTEPEIGVTEEMYNRVKDGIAELLGEDDLYLETFHPDIKYSDAPVAVTISEDIADIYQDLGNFISIFKHGNKETMNDSLVLCLQNFREYWGQRLVNALRALHSLRYKHEEDTEIQ